MTNAVFCQKLTFPNITTKKALETIDKQKKRNRKLSTKARQTTWQALYFKKIWSLLMSALVCVLALRVVVNQLLQSWKRKSCLYEWFVQSLKSQIFCRHRPSPHFNNASRYILKNQNKANSTVIANSSIIVIDLVILYTKFCAVMLVNTLLWHYPNAIAHTL